MSGRRGGHGCRRSESSASFYSRRAAVRRATSWPTGPQRQSFPKRFRSRPERRSVLAGPPSGRHSSGPMHMADPRLIFQHKHLLGIEGLQPYEIQDLLDRADGFVALNRQADKKLQVLKGLTQINLFFESSTRTQTSFE